MKNFELINGTLHIIAGGAYGIIGFAHSFVDIHAVLAFAMSGIGVCYIRHYLDGHRGE
jgi:hypothetical protein